MINLDCMKKVYYIAVMAVSALMCTSCSDMNSLHDPYLKDGETIYLAKFDSVSVHSGNRRVMVEYWLSDPKAKQCLVEWNLGYDKATLPITLSEGDTPNVFYLNDLDETTLSFSFTSCSEDLKYTSLKTNSTCIVYGEKYIATLMNATVKSAKYDSKKNNVTIIWTSNYEGVVGYSVKYKDTSGVERVVRCPVDTKDRIAVLADFPQDGSFSYAAVYLPTEGAVDEFMPEYVTYTVK